MAKVPNPRKQFQFNIFISGMDPFLAQEVKTPDVEFDVAEHGDAGFTVKTAGMKKIGTLTLNKIMPSQRVDNQFQQWQKEIFNTAIGGGSIPDLYKRNIIVEEYGNDGRTVIHREILKGCWPQKINGRDLNRKGSENTIESIEFSVDETD